MCGRYLVTSSPDALAEWFGYSGATPTAARYNVAPTQAVPIVRLAADGKTRECVLARWGLIPSWSKDATGKGSTFNARAETLQEKPAFRGPFRSRRCLVVADGFYEWRDEGRKHKVPYAALPKDGRPVAFAGLWDRWQGPDGETIESMTVVTTDANPVLRPLHERMPVILSPEAYDAWLSPSSTPAELMALLRPCPPDRLMLCAVPGVGGPFERVPVTLTAGGQGLFPELAEDTPITSRS